LGKGKYTGHLHIGGGNTLESAMINGDDPVPGSCMAGNKMQTDKELSFDIKETMPQKL